MKDLSKLDIPKKSQNSDAEKSLEKLKPSNKRKKIIIIAIICLLSVAVASKLINKHLKKLKAEEKAQSIEQTNNTEKQTESKKDNKTNNNDQKPDFSEETPSGKMIFTFYDNLKHESVIVDAKPQAQRAQYKYTYIYQVASFRNMNETSWYVKKMKEVGLEPKFKRVGNWIRMYIGPYDSTRAIAPDIIKLQRIGLNGGFSREVSRTKIEPKDNIKADKDQRDKANKSQNNDSTDNQIK